VTRAQAGKMAEGEKGSFFVCGNCGRPYPLNGNPYRCPHCGGAYEVAASLRYAPIDRAHGTSLGIGQYRETFPLPKDTPLISLGEGHTPLIGLQLQDRTVHFKCEHLNPTGSFKDRGTVVLVSALAHRGVTEAVEDSSGNAGASFAAYAARAGIRARVFIPDYAAGPKRAQIEAYGAEVVRIPGSRSAVTEVVLKAAEEDVVYASHVYMPHGFAGISTLAFEIYEQLGRAPGAVVAPVGQGSIVIGMDLGFKALLAAGEISHMPALIGVQARACAPIWAVYTAGAAGLEWVSEGETIAEGVRTYRPLRGDAVLQAVEDSGGFMVAVDEPSIRSGRDALAQRGLYVEPTSAVVWPALLEHLGELEDPVVAVLSGSGFKDLRV
jgi:threonine synthase